MQNPNPKSKTVEDLLAIAYPFGNAPPFAHTEESRVAFSEIAGAARRVRDLLDKDLVRLRESLGYQDGAPGRDNRALFEQRIAETEAAIEAMKEQEQAAGDLCALSTLPANTPLSELYSRREQQALAFAAAQGVQPKHTPDPPAKAEPVRPWSLPD